MICLPEDCRMAGIVNEVWSTPGENGIEKYGCIHAGSMGDGARAMLVEEGASFRFNFVGYSHFDTLTKYHAAVHSEVTNPNNYAAWAFEPYPQEWADLQSSEGIDADRYPEDPPRVEVDP